MSLRELEPILAPLTHGRQALAHIQAALAPLSVEERVGELARTLLTEPLTHADAQARVGGDIEEFRVLQGDVIRTESAYSLGVRVVDWNSYMVATSTCDLISGRRTTALLMPVAPKRRSDYKGNARQLWGELDKLTLYQPTRYFYLPRLPDDDDDVLFNVVKVDPLAMCSNDDVNVAERRASLSLVGWRLFGACVREIMIREADQEAKMRTDAAVPQNPVT